MRRLILSLVVAGALAAIGAAPAAAAPPAMVVLPAAACDNPGTANARTHAPMHARPHIPHRHGGMPPCMTMPAGMP